MRRLVICSMVVSVLVVGAPAQATLTASTGLAQSLFAGIGISTPTGAIGGNLYARIEVGANSVGTAATPNIRFEASGSTYQCDLAWNCVSRSFPTQVINPTAFSMDPAGNSGTFRACLVPTSGPCAAFDLTFTRPGAPFTLCVPACAYPNAWYDPTTSTVGGGLFALAGVQRSGYQINGVWADSLPIQTSGMNIYSFELMHASTES